MEKYHISPETAPKALDWIKTRGGIAVWQSVNLSNPGATWTTPATILIRNVNGTIPANQQRLCPDCLKPARTSAIIGGNYSCEECKRRNYITVKSRVNDRERIEMKKYCRWDRQHTVHRETR